MRRSPALSGNALRVAAVALLASAAGELGALDLGARGRGEGDSAVYRPNPERVAVLVDGWVIEVGDVAAAILPRKPGTAPRVESVARVQRAGAVLSRYDHLIHWHASSHGLDWRLVAALIQEESGFRPEAVSPKGAVGLMQVRAIAAEDVGETDFTAPHDNIRTGVRYLKRLDALFAPAGGGRDRLALVLAAYNMGPAHVRDAQTLARHYGYDPQRWDNSMARILPLLEDPRFHATLPSGYAQGSRTATYVERILNRYERFRVEAGEVPGLAGPVDQAASARG